MDSVSPNLAIICLSPHASPGALKPIDPRLQFDSMWDPVEAVPMIFGWPVLWTTNWISITMNRFQYLFGDWNILMLGRKRTPPMGAFFRKAVEYLSVATLWLSNVTLLREMAYAQLWAALSTTNGASSRAPKVVPRDAEESRSGYNRLYILSMPTNSTGSTVPRLYPYAAMIAAYFCGCWWLWNQESYS